MNRKSEQTTRNKVITYTEKFDYAQSASVYADFNKNLAIAAETCQCHDPLKCSCRAYCPPSPRPVSMDHRLYKDPRPFLVYTLTRKDNPDSRVTFVCKKEFEVKNEVLRLNSKEKDVTIPVWNYVEEIEWNKAAKSDHRNFLTMLGEYDKNL